MSFMYLYLVRVSKTRLNPSEYSTTSIPGEKRDQCDRRQQPPIEPREKRVAQRRWHWGQDFARTRSGQGVRRHESRHENRGSHLRRDGQRPGRRNRLGKEPENPGHPSHSQRPQGGRLPDARATRREPKGDRRPPQHRRNHRR